MKCKLLLLLLLETAKIYAVPLIDSVTSITSTSVLQYQKLEIGINSSTLLPSQILNPYNPADVSMYAIFTDPNGKTYKRDAFWYQPFNRCDTCANNIIIPFVCDWQDVSENDIPNDPNQYLTPQTTNFPWRVRFAPKFNNPVYVKTRNKKRIF